MKLNFIKMKSTKFYLSIFLIVLLSNFGFSQSNNVEFEAKAAQTPTFDVKDVYVESNLKSRNDSIITFAKKYLGTKYRYGGMSPATGFDCSGFVNFVFLNFGVKLPRSSREFVTIETKVKKEECVVGDILVFAGGNPAKRPIGHVAIVSSIANNDIEFIHASTRSTHGGIIITKLSESEYYKKRLVTIVRK
jgi:cell wall-associated NlpC family hydrolase